MSGFLNNLHDHHQQHRERREERHEARHERHDRGGRRDDHDDHDDHGSQHRGQRRPYEDEGDEPRRPQSYEPQFQGQGRGFAPPAGLPPSARVSLGGLDRGDFASDEDINRMIASGEFDKRQGREERGNEYGYSGAGGERGNAYGRYDTPPSGPPPGQGYGERASEYGRYDAPSGPPPGRGYQGQQSHQQGYESGGAYAASSYGRGSERENQYGSQETRGRSQYEAPQGPPPGHGRDQGKAPSGGFVASHDGEERSGPGYGGPRNDRSEPSRRGEAASYYDQQGQGDRYARLAGVAQEHENDDPEPYRRATQGLHEKIQSQEQSRRPRRDDEEEDYKTHVAAHRKAYGGDDHGPMDADAIGAAAAMEAFKQTAAGSSNAPAGAFQTGKASGGFSSKPGREEEEEEEDTTAARGGASGGMQDKLMALAMSQAGKLFDKKNAGSSASGGGSQDKAQAMQSAAATAMELFTQYQSKGKVDSGSMSTVMGLAMKLL